MAKLQNRGDVALFGVPDLAVDEETGEVAITVSDTTVGFLDAKVVAGANIFLFVIPGGGDQQLEISAADSILNVLETAANISAATVTGSDLDIIKNTSAGTITLNLPALADFDKKLIVFAGLTGTITIDPFGSEEIDGVATLNVTAGQSRTIFPFSDEWSTI